MPKRKCENKRIKVSRKCKVSRFQEDEEHGNESCVSQTEETVSKEKTPKDFEETKRQKKRKRAEQNINKTSTTKATTRKTTENNYQPGTAMRESQPPDGPAILHHCDGRKASGKSAEANEDEEADHKIQWFPIKVKPSMPRNAATW